MEVDEFIELIVEGGTGDGLRRIVYLNENLTLFQHDGHDALIVHEEVGHTNGIEQPRKAELSVYDFTGVNVLQFVILNRL